MIEIKNRWTNEVIYRSETAQSVKEALKEAVRSGASLVGAEQLLQQLRGSPEVAYQEDGVQHLDAIEHVLAGPEPTREQAEQHDMADQ
jgi:cell division septation protein DedD